jgi:hypothetical protein
MRQQITVERVVHHRGVDAAEHAVLDQPDLAAPTLLGRRSQKLDRAR